MEIVMKVELKKFEELKNAIEEQKEIVRALEKNARKINDLRTEINLALKEGCCEQPPK